MDEQQQELAAFQSSINDTEATEQATTAADAVAVESQDAGAVADGAEQGAVAQAEVSDAAQGQPEKATPAAEDDDPVLLDGLKRSELRRLFESAAEVGTLKRQIDKAHGHIGELNRKLQQAAQAQATPARAPELPPEIQQFEAANPEVAQYVRALGVTPQQPQTAPPADVQQPAYADAQPAQAGLDPLDIELVVMDRMHKGWREKISTQDFNLWLGSQGEQAQQVFHTAQTADELSAVLGQYDQWASARAAASDKVARGQQRLQRALTPSGNAPLPQSAPTELDAFRAALKS
jgi:hypothetical protein